MRVKWNDLASNASTNNVAPPIEWFDRGMFRGWSVAVE